MSVKTYLDSIASNAILKDSSITTSIATLRARLGRYFTTNDVTNHFIFGSNTRYTMLPRRYDPQSDVDYMIVFNSTGHQPQAYLNRLKSFVEYYYTASEIKQSHPTIRLNLNHITFELVPALYNVYYGYQIPAPASNFQTWISTDPNAFNISLTEKNKNNHHLIKPLIRVLKYWNANAGYVFESYELEKTIVSMNFLFCYNLKDYFYSAVESIHCSYLAPQWKQSAIKKLKKAVAEAKEDEANGWNYLAEDEIKKILPEI